MKNQKSMGNKGFSLVELIVVIAIMAVLVGVLAPQFIGYVNKSRASTDMQNLQQVKTTVEAFYADYDGSTGFTLTYAANTTGGVLTDTNGALSDAGISTPTLKSSNWTAISMAYAKDATTGKWTWTITGTNSLDATKYNLALL
jgi:type IV pilus assembly protein PilA